jgi:hypothetical protein
MHDIETYECPHCGREIAESYRLYHNCENQRPDTSKMKPLPKGLSRKDEALARYKEKQRK